MQKLTIIEPYELINSGTSMNLTVYRMFQYLISEIYINKTLKEETFYELNIEKYANLFKIDKESAYKILLNSMDIKLVPVITLPAILFNPKAKATKYRKFIFFNSIEYSTANQSLQVRFSPEIVSLYNALGEEGRYYAKYLLEYTREMQSMNSINLFRLLNKWKKLGKASFALEEFKKLMGFTPEEYTLWDNLHSKVIKPAVRDINKLTDIWVNVVLEKQGRKVVGVGFKVGKNPSVG